MLNLWPPVNEARICANDVNGAQIAGMGGDAAQCKPQLYIIIPGAGA